jgi:PKD repeat protein
MRNPLNCLFFFIITAITGCNDDEPQPLEACITLPGPFVRNQEITFDGSCSSNAKVYTWDFGDGLFTNGKIAKHIYAEEGTYEVTLIARDGAETDSISKTINVTRSQSEQHCRPAYLKNPGFWPHMMGTYDSAAFSYLTGQKLDEIKLYDYGQSRTQQNMRIKPVYSGNKLTSFEWYERDISAEHLTNSFLLEYDNLDRIVKVRRVSHNGGTADTLRTNTFIYDAQNRITEIQSNDDNGALHQRIVYAHNAAGHVAAVDYSKNTQYGSPASRQNLHFSTTLPFYAASPELTIYFEYVVLVEPLKHTYASRRVFNTWTQDGTTTYFGGSAGVLLGYTYFYNDKSLVSAFYIPDHANNIPTDVVFTEAVYFCE